MAEDAGKMLELLDIAELSSLYQSSIRKMQPAVLLRRGLESEKVSTRGHMPELRARLLRLEARKSHPQLEVPWYPEDDIPKKDIAEDKNGKSEISNVTKIPRESNAVKMTTKKCVKCVQPQIQTAENQRIEQKEKQNKTESSNIKPRESPYYCEMDRLPIHPSIHPDNGKIKDQRESNFELQKFMFDNQQWTEAIYKIMNLKIHKAELEAKNTNFISDQDQDNYQSQVNQQPFVTRRNFTAPQQPEEASGPIISTKSMSSRLNASGIPHNTWMPTETYKEFGERRENENHDEDPFENVDSGDWMDDYIE